MDYMNMDYSWSWNYHHNYWKDHYYDRNAYHGTINHNHYGMLSQKPIQQGNHSNKQNVNRPMKSIQQVPQRPIQNNQYQNNPKIYNNPDVKRRVSNPIQNNIQRNRNSIQNNMQRSNPIQRNASQSIKIYTPPKVRIR